MSQRFDPSQRPAVTGMDWMITADHPLAVQAGADVLSAGGNAVDAAVAANAVLTVVVPHMCGPGGDLFALIHDAKAGETKALNASGRAPAAATIDAYREKGYSAVPETGILTCTVPGALEGWRAALAAYGTMPLHRLLAAAIRYAERGFPMYPNLQTAIAFRETLFRGTPAEAVFLPAGKIPEEGEICKRPALAETYRTLAGEGVDAFYKGKLGRALVDFITRRGGFITQDDLAAHTVTREAPIQTGYRGYSVLTHPPNSQGIALLMQADMLETVEAAAYEFNGADLIHRMVEGKKLAFADRDRYVCDPAFHRVPVEKMLDKAGAKKRAGMIETSKAAGAYPPRDFTQGGEDTVYLAVVDGKGNAVSWIQSLYEPFGSCEMDPETGIILHNRGRGFTLDPDHPNRLEPGKRPYHTLHPAMIEKAGRPVHVLGTPGADGQTQSVIQMITALIDFGADPQQAVETPRWRSNPDGALLMESRFPEATIAALRDRGHDIIVSVPMDPVMGSAQVIKIDDDGVRSAGADPRRTAYAAGS